MFDFFEGIIIEKTPAQATINCNGVGYCLNISLNTYSLLPENGKAKIYCHLAIREDAHVLYGFHNKEERQLFKQLISVNGVGSSTAIMILSALPPAELIGIIASGNDLALKAIKGVGPKTALRILVELKDKIGKTGIAAELFPAFSGNKVREEALSALLVLGYQKAAIEKSLDKMIRETPSITVEELIRISLKTL